MSEADYFESRRKLADTRRAAMARPDLDPDKEAESLRLARERQMPVSLVRGNEEQVLEEHPEPVQAATQPVVASKQRDPELAPVIKDDIDNLDFFERQSRSITQSRKQGLRNVEASQIGNRQMWGDATDEDIARGIELDDLSAGIIDYEHSYPGGFLPGFSEQIPIMTQLVWGAKEEAAVGAFTGAAIGTLVPLPAAGTALGAAWGGRVGFKVGMAHEAFNLESGLAYREYMGMEGTGQTSFDINGPQTQEGMSHEVAKGAAIAVGIVNAGLEFTGASYVLKTFPGMDKVLGSMTREGMKKLVKIPTVREALIKYGKTVTKGSMLEGGTEGLQELVTTIGGVVAGRVSDGEFDAPTSGEVVSRVWESFVKGTQGAGVMVGIGASGQLAADSRRINKAEQRAQLFAELGVAAGDSKTRQRLPAGFQKIIKEVQTEHGEVTHIFVAPEILKKFFQDTPIDEGMPETARSLAESEETGADISIPLDEFVTYMAASDQLGGIIPDLRFAVDDLTQREAQVMQREIEKELKVWQDRQNATEGKDNRVYEDMKRQLEEAGRSPAVAEYEARFYQDRFDTLGEQLGVDPYEYFQSYNLSVQNEDLRALGREGVDRMSNILDMIRSGNRPSQGDVFGDTFGEMIAKRGGIQDSGGELKARDYDRRLVDSGKVHFSNRKISQEDGMTFDEAIGVGIEEGYFPESALDQWTSEEVLEHLDNEVGGNPVYRDSVDETQLGIQEDIDRLEAAMQEFGIDVNEVSNQDILYLLEKNKLFQVTDTRNDMGYYSQVARVVKTMNLPEWKNDGRAKGNVIWQKLHKSGVKKEELEWLGIENWLAAGHKIPVHTIPIEDMTPEGIAKMRKAQDKFSRQNVIDFVANNGVDVETVVADKLQDDNDGELSWYERQIWDDSEAWESHAEDMAEEWKNGEDVLGIDLDDEFVEGFTLAMSWLEDEISEAANEIQDSEVAEGYLERVDRAIRDHNPEDARYVMEEKLGMDLDARLHDWFEMDMFEVVKDAANEYARESYYENPIYTIEAYETADNTTYHIFGNDDQGYDIRIDGTEWRDSIFNNDQYRHEIYSEGEAMIQATQHAMENEHIYSHNDEQVARWDGYVTPFGTEIGVDNDYREVKLILPELYEADGRTQADFYYDAHFEDRNILAFLRTTERSGLMYFVDEMQSDWHQQGRKAGYKTGSMTRDEVDDLAEKGQVLQHDIKEEFKFWLNQIAEATPFDQALDDKLFEFYKIIRPDARREEWDFNGSPGLALNMMHDVKAAVDGTGEFGSRNDKRTAAIKIIMEIPEMERMATRLQEVIDIEKGVESEKYGVPNAPFKGDNWLALAVKRGLVMAAEEGKKKFGWADSNVQAQRWSESYRTLYETQYDKKMVSAVKKLTGIKPEHRTLDGEPWTPPEPHQIREFDGKYEIDFETDLDEDEAGYSEGYQVYRVQEDGSLLAIYDRDTPAVFEKREEAEHYIEYIREHDRDNFNRSEESLSRQNSAPDQGYWSIPITDELRETITTEGFTLFQKKKIQGVADEGEAAVGKVYNKSIKGYIQFNDARDFFNITLTKDADLSTFVHESGHFFLETQRRALEHENATDQMKRDMAIVEDFLGAEPGAEFTTEQHEKYARAWEAYTFEGRAPSLKLAAVFERFSAWMKSVYKTMKKLDVELTDEVRGVFDRMLATDEMIEEAKGLTGFMPAIQGVDTTLMSPEAYAEYVKMYNQQIINAKDDLEKELMAEVSKEARKQLAEDKREAKIAIAAELDARPEYAALKHIKEVQRLSNPILKAMYGAVPKRMPVGSHVLEGGVHPDEVAEQFGYKSGDEMIQAILKAPKKSELLAKMVDEAVRPKDSMRDGTAHETVLKSLHNDGTANFLHIELKALGKKIGQNSSLKVIQAAARKTVAGMRIMDLKPGKYRAAEKRAYADSVKALRDKNYPAAHDAKRRQLLNHEMYRQVTQAKIEAEKTYAYLKGFGDRKVQERLGKTDYRDAINTLLEGVEMKKKSLKEIGQRKSLLKFIESMAADEQIVLIPERLQNESLLTNYKEMQMGEFQALQDAVKNIDHLSRLKNKLMLNKERRDFGEAIEASVASIYAANDAKKVEEVHGKNKAQKSLATAKSWVATAHAQLSKIEFITKWLDGGVGGYVHELVFQPFVDAQTAKYDMLKSMNDKLKGIFTGRSGEQISRHKSKFKFMDRTLNGEEIISVALNVGNEGNLFKLTDGYRWDRDQLMEELNAWMTNEDWQMVQDLWDTINLLWPDLSAVHERATGLPPAKVEATPVETKFGTFAGGYMPVVYDPAQVGWESLKQSVNQERKAAEGLFENNHMRPDVDGGMTISRAAGYSAPIKLSLDVIPMHINETVHYITHYEAVVQVHKVTNNKAFTMAVVETMGKEIHSQFKPWLQSIANDSNVPPDLLYIDSIAKQLRGGMTVVAMGFKLSTATMQMFGLFTTVKEIGMGATLNGLTQMMRHPKSTWDFINAESGEMRHILSTFDRDVRKTVDQSFGKTNVVDLPKQYAFHLMGYIQKSVNMITWKGAYDKAIDEGHDHAKAVRMSDSAVRMSQSAGGVKDLAAIQRGGNFQQTVVMFYTYFSALYNQFTDTGRAAKKGDPAVIAHLTWLIVAPTFFEILLRDKGTEEEDEMGSSEWLTWFAAQNLLYATTAVPFGRDLASGAMSKYGYNISPVTKFGKDLAKAYNAVSDKVTKEDEMTWGDFKALVNAGGVAFKLPTGQALQFAEYFRDFDRVEDPIRELLVGLDYDHKSKEL